MKQYLVFIEISHGEESGIIIQDKITQEQILNLYNLNKVTVLGILNLLDKLEIKYDTVDLIIK